MNYFGGLLFLGAGLAVLVLWPALVVMAVIWIVLGLFFLAFGFRSARKDTEDAKLLRTGMRADAIVTAVRDTGVTVNQSPRVELTLQVLPDGAPAFELKAKRVVSRVSVPRVDETYAIRYDPKHPDHFVWDDSAPAASVSRSARSTVSGAGGDLSEQLEAKGLDHERAQKVEDALQGVLQGNLRAPGQDPLDRLQKLAELKAKGVLTEAEFAAEKAKILGAS
jgi:hypothetical protein